MARFFLLIFIVFLSSCSAPTSLKQDRKSRLIITKAGFSDFKGWDKGEHEGALTAFRKSCDKFDKLPDSYYLGYPSGRVKEWRSVCKKARVIKDSEAKIFFESNFVPYKVSGRGRSDGLFTGYYEPELEGSRKEKGDFKHAVYKRPPNLVKPFLGRRRIENGELKGKGLELAYVKDPVELFFLHIQGSGRIKLDDGKTMRVGYADQNGCSYTSIGRYLVDQGVFELDEVTAPKIKNWLYNNPDKAKSAMNNNQSFVFFRELSGEGPIGGQGVALTPEHSLAVDKNFIPYGTPVWLETTLPVSESKTEPYNRLMVAQDTGGAIKGPVRGDVFFGYGKRARELAGRMKQEGQYYLLTPRNP